MIWVLTLAIGCDEEKIPVQSPLSVIDATNMTDIIAIDSSDTETATVTFLAVNEFGLATRTDETINVDVWIDGNYSGLELSFDAFGYATADVGNGSPTAAAFKITESENEFNHAYLLHPTPKLTVPISSPLPYSSQQPDHVVRSADGHLLAYGSELWWRHSTAASIAHQVADLGSPILGLWNEHIDTDGISDALAWTENQVFALRGRPGGGLSWGTAFEISSGNIVGVSSSDLDGDNIPDIAIGITQSSTSQTLILKGDGMWGFVEGVPLKLDYPIETMVANDENLDGFADISVIDSSTGHLRRNSWDEAGWIGGIPALITPSAFIASEGSTMPPMHDVNGDGREDLMIFGGSGNNIQDLTFFVIGNSVTKYQQQYAPFKATFADVDKNESKDIFALDNDDLHVVQFNQETGGFSAKTINGFGERAALSVDYSDGDDIKDITIFQEDAHIYAGVDDEQSGWLVSRPTWRNYSTAFDKHHVLGDFNSDGQLDVFGYINDGSKDKLEASTFTVNDQGIPSLVQLDIYTFGSGAVALDMVTCGNDVITLTHIGDTYQLRRLNLVNGSVQKIVGRNTWAMSEIDCSVIDGKPMIVVGVGYPQWWLVDGSTMQFLGETDDNGFNDIAIGDINGSGTASVRGCLEEGCQIEMADLDGDGKDEIIVAAETVTVTGWGQTITLDKTGTIATADIDGDGIEELLLRDPNSNVDWVYRGLNGGIAPTFGFRMTDHEGLGSLHDVDGDSILEVVLRDADGNLLLSPLSSTN